MARKEAKDIRYGRENLISKQAFHSFLNKQIGHVARPVRDQKKATVFSLEVNIFNVNLIF